MAVRPIDGNALHAVISAWPESIMYKDWVQSAIATAPTLTPPNEPLTLEQLREMDGEPVWVVPTGMHEKDEPMWCVLESPMALIPGVDYWSWDFDGYGEAWIAYRRPPEGEADETE